MKLKKAHNIPLNTDQNPKVKNDRLNSKSFKSVTMTMGHRIGGSYNSFSCLLYCSCLLRLNVKIFFLIRVRDTYKYSFFVRTIPAWNRLPQEAVEATSVAVFQTRALPVVRDLQPTTTHQRL